MGDNLFDDPAKKIKNDIAKEAEQINSIEQAVLHTVAVSWDSVMDHVVKPKIAELFKPREAKEQAHQCGKSVLARTDKAMFDAYETA